MSDREREVRLGLVLYGGVSLATYICGVCTEFARLARRDDGVYGLIKAVTDSRAAIDVISGTSAGGINGVALAIALTQQRDFAALHRVWLESGDIEALLRPIGQARCDSVLDGASTFEDALAAGFERLLATADERTPVPAELDLFVMGTSLEGNYSREPDGVGRDVAVRDHRTLFWLKHRTGRKEVFNPAPVEGARTQTYASPPVTVRALAKLARLTASFPGAFEPTRIECGHNGPAPGGASALERKVDHTLQEWGSLPNGVTHYIDGGVLANKPFTPTIKAIFGRLAVDEVKRWLFYVDPAPAEDPNAVPGQAPPAAATNFVAVTAAALVGIPMSQSIGPDLQVVAERNQRLERYNRVADGLIEARAVGRRRRRRSRQADVADWIYLRSRLVDLSERATARLATTGLASSRGNLLRWFDVWVRGGAGPWPAAEATDAAAARVLEQRARAVLVAFDVFFQQRRLYQTSYYARDHLYRGTGVGAPAAMASESAWAELSLRYRRLRRQLNVLIELDMIIAAAMEDTLAAWLERSLPERALRSPDGDLYQRLWTGISTVLGRLLDVGAPPRTELERVLGVVSDGGVEPVSLSPFAQALRAWSTSVVAETGDVATADGIPETLLARIDALGAGVIGQLPADDPVATVYHAFDEVDRQLFPLELAGGLYEKDAVRPVRISPDDARTGFSSRPWTEKLAGEQVVAFGGFFKRAWRANDLLVGRLDGICRIVETLLDHDRLVAVAATPAWRAAVRDRVFEEYAATWERSRPRPICHPDALFPAAPPPSRAACARWLWALLSDDEAARAVALDLQVPEDLPAESPPTFGTVRRLLIEAAQLEVLAKDLSAVQEAAAEDARRWAPHTLPKPAEPPVLPAPVTVTWPRDTDLGRRYLAAGPIGRENLATGVPGPVLRDILAKIGLLVRTCLLSSQSAAARPRVEGNFFYRFIVDLPLRVNYWAATVERRWPGRYTRATWLVTLVCLVALATTGVWWWRSGLAETLPPPLAVGLGAMAALAHLARFLRDGAFWAPPASIGAGIGVPRWLTVAVLLAAFVSLLIGPGLLTLATFLLVATLVMAVEGARTIRGWLGRHA